MAKLIKKYLNTPGPVPKPNFNNDEFWSDYKYRWDTYDENKFKKYANDFDFTGVGKYILIDENGRPVPRWKADKIEAERMQQWEQLQQAYEDAKNAQIDENGDIYKTLDEVTVVPGQNLDLLSPSIDKYLEAPTYIPKTVDLDETFRELEKWHQEQSQEHREALDRLIHETNKYVDLLGLSPFIITGGAIAGAAAIPWLGGKLTAFALANPAIANSLFYGTLGGEAFNYGTKLFGYEDAGHWAYHKTGHNFADYDKLPEWQKTLWNFTNPGYFVSGGSKLISKSATLAEQAARRMFQQPYKILNLAQRLGQTPAAAAYKGYLFMNTANRLYNYGSQATKSLIKDVGFYTAPESKIYTAFKADDPNILRGIRPSDREHVLRLTNAYRNLEEYKNKPLSYSYEGKATGYNSSGPKLDVTTTYTSYPDGSNHGETFTIKYKNPEEVRRQIQEELDLYKRYPELSPWRIPVYEQLLLLDFEQPLNLNLNYSLSRRIPFATSTETKPLTLEAQKMTELLGDYGHVTGSSITATSSFAQHTPGDVDVITTQRNLPEVLRRLGFEGNANTINIHDGHTKVWSPKFNAYVDVQVLESSPSGKAMGKISYETYSKLFPKEFESMRNMETPIGELPISSEELLKLHKDNVYNISLQDQFLSGKPKHVDRNFAILGANNSEEVQTAYDAMINSYRTPIGDKFQTFEDQGIHIDYSDVENNLEFLKRLGYDEHDAKIVAQDPLKMKFLTEEYAYRRTTSNRSIEEAKLYGNNPNRITDAINTNVSYSNVAGNQARFSFGGAENALSYGGNKGWVTSFQYPIRNPEKIHKPLDVFNEIGKFVVAPPESHPNIAEQLRKYFRFSEDVAKKIQEILDLSFTPETLNDVTPQLVPHVNPHLTKGTNGDKVKLFERVGNINDQIAKILDIDHIYSMQPGFGNDFVGRLLKDIPGLRSSTTLISPAQQYGYELPHIIPPDVLEHHTFLLHKNTFDSKNPTHVAARHRYANARNKQIKALNEQKAKEKEIFNLLNTSLRARDRFRGNLARTSAVTGILGGGIGIGYGLSHEISPMSQYLKRGDHYLEREGYTPKQIDFIEKEVNKEINHKTLTEDRFNKILDLALIMM